LHPPVPLLIPHFSVHACNIGYTIPRETRVIISAWAIRGDDVTNIDLKGKCFHFLPFGLGRRMCPGVHSAIAAIETMLANMYHFDWELSLGLNKEEIDMTEVFGIAVQRKEKLLLVPRTVRVSTSCVQIEVWDYISFTPMQSAHLETFTSI
ncbi:indole-2-monooxygenase, partial [Dichanthelium oligosanthes]